MHASSRNDGCIHIGVDLKKNSLKLKYLQRSVKIFPNLAKDLDIDYREDGQMVVINDWYLVLPALLYLKKKVRQNKIPRVKFLFRKELFKKEPNLNKKAKMGVLFESAACISPYEFTIALAESALLNKAKISLHTYVDDIKVKDNKIEYVSTNRGKIYPKIVINAAGVFSEEIAKLAKDHFYSIHPRKGTDIILDKNAYPYLSNTGIQTFKLKKKKDSHSKGGGIIPTIDKNVLIGPDTIETYLKEDFSTEASNINNILKKHQETIPNLKRSDIITYFSGIRAPSYNEDFIIEKGRATSNIIHVAGIQSPGLTAAPAISIDVAKMVLELLTKKPIIKKNFNPIRKNIIKLNTLSDEKRDLLIKENKDYGIIICRCEEISKGEILDAIHSILPATTVDAIKRRVRAGMGRCQGGFCQPIIVSLIAKELNIPLEEVSKKGEGRILYNNIKEQKDE